MEIVSSETTIRIIFTSCRQYRHEKIEITYQNSEKIFESLSHGQVDAIEEAVEQITDEFMIYGLRGDLMDKLSRIFPDPRREAKISTKVVLTASMAGHFQDMYAMDLPSRKWGAITLRFAFTHITGRIGIECESAVTKSWLDGQIPR